MTREICPRPAICKGAEALVEDWWLMLRRPGHRGRFRDSALDQIRGGQALLSNAKNC
ncbi:MAG: hypothetical protein ABI056_04195 [Caulobacteraceae bacterium]